MHTIWILNFAFRWQYAKIVFSLCLEISPKQFEQKPAKLIYYLHLGLTKRPQ